MINVTAGHGGHRHEDVPDGVLPHHGRINDNYGQRYPPGASAVESDHDRGVATQIETHRNYLKSQQETFGDTLPSIKDDPVQFLNNTLTELVHSTKKLYRLERAKVPLGRNYTIALTVSGGSAVTHINFLQEGPEYQRWAPGMNIDVPGRKVMQLTVINDSAGVVGFETNLDINEMRARNTLTSGDQETVSFDFPVIESVNVVTMSGNNNVRMIVSF